MNMFNYNYSRVVHLFKFNEQGDKIRVFLDSVSAYSPYASSNVNCNSTLYLNNGIKFEVMETVEEIDKIMRLTSEEVDRMMRWTTND